MPPLIVSNAASTSHRPATRSLFENVTFFLLQKLPARSQLIADIEANGGKITKIEQDADYIIADHARKDAPKGSYSWTLIKTAIQDGEMPNLADHPAGPPSGSVREVASGIPAKGTRTAFTLEDDRELWQWVQKELKSGGHIKGIEIYKRLEAVNPRHTLQSWRDRYLKKLHDKPPAGVELTVPANPPPSPPMAQDEQEMSDGIRTPPVKRRRVEESPEQVNEDLDEMEDDSRDQDDIDMGRLLKEAKDIEEIQEENHDEAWDAWARAYPHRSAGEWIQFWQQNARPISVKQCADRKPQENANESIHEREPRKRKRETSDTNTNDPRLRKRLANVETEQPIRLASLETVPDLDHKKINHAAIEPEAGQAGTASPEEALASDLPTSDANQAANKQILNEVFAGSQQEASDHEISDEDDEVYQSALNTPRQHTTAEGISHDVSETPQRRKPQSPLAERDKSDGASVVSEDGDHDDDDPEHANGTALTEANLAAQEAQYRPPVRRGIDLPEDDPANDQSEFLDHLQALIGGGLPTASMGQQIAASDAFASQKPVGDEHLTAESLNHVSQDDIDEAIRQNLEWPSSPQGPSPRRNATLAQVQQVEHFGSPPSAGNIKQHDNPAAQQQARNDHYNGAPNSEHSTEDDEDEDLSDHDVDLTVAIPDNEVGFDPSSDRNSQLFMSEGSPEPQTYADNNIYHKQQTAADVIEISSASPPSSPLDSSEHGEVALSSADQAATGRLLETQDIYGAETQQPDLFMPLPPDSTDDEDDDDRYGEENEDDDNEDEVLQPAETTPRPSSRKSKRAESPTPSPEINSQEQAVQLESWMATMNVRGHEESRIIDALKCTSMNLDLAELVLMHVKAGKGIPDDVPGVWTNEEDEQVEGGNARALKWLEAKHGWPACAARLQFLEDYRDED